MSKTPWNSIAESVVNLEERHLSYQDALTSPCLSCPTSPCCTYLPIHTFQVTNLIELDHAIYLLNFDRVELGLSATGEWSVYYRYPCRFLDRQSFNCTIHNTPEQPQICVHYNPYHCWYKRVLTKSISDEFLRIDRQRLDYIVSLLIFDKSGNLTTIPPWETLAQGIANLPFVTDSSIDISPNNEIAQNSFLKNAESKEQKAYNYNDLENPCQDCQAYCCQTLVFPQAFPSNISNLDFLKFCLGFPGIELGIADDTWSIIIKTTCRHLKDHQCSVYGKPERPLLCKYYDAWKCTYKPNFGNKKTSGFFNIKLEQFKALTECFQFDEYGNIIYFPNTEIMRNQMEIKSDVI